MTGLGELAEPAEGLIGAATLPGHHDALGHVDDRSRGQGLPEGHRGGLGLREGLGIGQDDGSQLGEQRCSFDGSVVKGPCLQRVHVQRPQPSSAHRQRNGHQGAQSVGQGRGPEPGPPLLGEQVIGQDHALGLVRLETGTLAQGVLDLVDASHEVPGGCHGGRPVGHDPGHARAVGPVDSSHRQLGHALEGLLQRLLREDETAQGGQALGQL